MICHTMFRQEIASKCNTAWPPDEENAGNDYRRNQVPQNTGVGDANVEGFPTKSPAYDPCHFYAPPGHIKCIPQRHRRRRTQPQRQNNR